MEKGQRFYLENLLPPMFYSSYYTHILQGILIHMQVCMASMFWKTWQLIGEQFCSVAG